MKKIQTKRIASIILNSLVTFSLLVPSNVYAQAPTSNSAPVANNVTISGSYLLGETLTGSHGYADAENDSPATATFQWYTATIVVDQGVTQWEYSKIDNATNVEYVVTESVLGKIIAFGVTPKALTGTLSGNEVITITSDVMDYKATSVSIDSNVKASSEVKSVVEYLDIEGSDDGITYQWLISDTLDGTFEAITDATSATYKPVADQVDKYIKLKVNIEFGEFVGSSVYSSASKVLPAEAAPTATAVSVSGTYKAAEVLTGSFTYGDVNGDAEGTHTYRWLISDTENGTFEEIENATSATYTPVADQVHKYIKFEVTPKAATGNSLGDAVLSSASKVLPAEAAPTASDVSVSGTSKVDEVLTGSFTYGDVNGDAEGTHTYRWLISDTENGTFEEIENATSATYTPVADQVHKYIKFEVTPKAATGNSLGDAVLSSASKVLPAEAAPTASDVSVSGTSKVDAVLTGLYTYSDINGDLEDNETVVSTIKTSYQWYYATSIGEEYSYTAIEGATSSTYTLKVSDLGKLIVFGVTPVAKTGTTQGSSFKSAPTSAVSEKTIDIKDILGVIAPVAGRTPDTDVDSSDQFTASIQWSPAALDFDGTKKYSAAITLTPKTGYTLVGVTANYFVVDNATSSTNVENSGVVTAIYSTTKAAELDSIAITTLPTKLEYKVGEEFNIGGLVVTGTYSDDTTKAVETTLSGFDSSAVAEDQVITVTVGEKTTTFTVDIIKADGPVVDTSKLSMDDAANTFTNSGNQVLEYSTDDGINWSTTLPDLSGVLTLQVRVAATDTKNAGAISEFEFTVPTLSSIDVTTSDTRLTYKVGEVFDATGLVVTGTYSDNTTKAVVATLSGFDSSAVAEDQVITVTVGEKTTTFTVDIIKADGPAVDTSKLSMDDAANTFTNSGNQVLQYSVDSGVNWTDVLPTLTGTLTLSVRVKESATHLTGSPSETTYKFVQQYSLSITDDEEGLTLNTESTVDEKTDVTFTVTPKIGYTAVLSIGDKAVTLSNNEYILEDIDEDTDVELTYIKVDNHIVHVTESNVLLIGDYLFDLNDTSYNLTNFLKAAKTTFVEDGNPHMYYHIKGLGWFDLVADSSMENAIENITTINGDGLYEYYNMVLVKKPV